MRWQQGPDLPNCLTWKLEADSTRMNFPIFPTRLDAWSESTTCMQFSRLVSTPTWLDAKIPSSRTPLDRNKKCSLSRDVCAYVLFWSIYFSTEALSFGTIVTGHNYVCRNQLSWSFFRKSLNDWQMYVRRKVKLNLNRCLRSPSKRQDHRRSTLHDRQKLV